ncbi:restriction endonuclease subunit S [Corynebacterium matruchotii]
MSEWPMVKLKELMRKTRSIDPRKYPDEEFALYSIPAYDNGIPEKIFGRDVGSSKILLKDSDVVLSKIVPHIRRTWVITDGEKQIGSSEWIVFNDDRFDPQFIANYLKSDVFHYQLLTTVAGVGGSLNRARPAAVAELKIPLPPLGEQKRIAEILGGVSKAINEIRTEIKRVESLCGAVVSLYAEDQSTKKLEDLATLSGGLSLGSHRKNKPHSVGYLRVANVFWGKILYDEIKELNCTDQEFERTLLQDGDVLITEAHANRFQVGRSAVFRGEGQALVFQNHLFRARPNKNIDSDVLAAMLSSVAVRRQLYQMAKTTSGLNTISISQVRSLRVPVLDTTKQAELLSFLQESNKLNHLLHRKLSLLQELQKSLASRAFAGLL